MSKFLIPFDGSDSALRAVRYIVSLAKEISGTEIELLYVQDPVPLKVHAGASNEQILHRQADEADRILQPARQLLDAENLPYQVRCRTGSPANEIAQHVDETHCDGVIMGTRGMSPLASLMIGSIATRTVHLVTVPVTLVK